MATRPAKWNQTNFLVLINDNDSKEVVWEDFKRLWKYSRKAASNLSDQPFALSKEGYKNIGIVININAFLKAAWYWADFWQIS